ncbi:MAG: FeoB small GTPase domain-containing protein [Pseudomonadota bacterium]|nr:FeoB small GTPase domain-containing protein [Pseudomonadota bacterium]
MRAPLHPALNKTLRAFVAMLPREGLQALFGRHESLDVLLGAVMGSGNWAGKTVERREGTLQHAGETLTVVDLPGTYSLTANSPKERIARDFILHERPDVVVMIANAASLERNLYLLAELLLLPVPVVLGLNMMDVAQAQGIEIEPHVLAAALGIPVIPLVASRARGVAELLDEALRLARQPAEFKPARPEIAAPHRAVLASVRSALGGGVKRRRRGRRRTRRGLFFGVIATG